MIKIEHLQKYFNRGKRSELHVLNDITLELPQTGLVCILGESGSGKTTLMSLLQHIYPIQGGHIRIGKHDIAEIDNRSLRQRIGTCLLYTSPSPPDCS